MPRSLGCIASFRFALALRLRAAIFVNLVSMREAVSLRHGFILPPQMVKKLRTSSYLFHSALNCAEAALYPEFGVSCLCSGLAAEAIAFGTCRWKLRPKLHKPLVCRDVWRGIGLLLCLHLSSRAWVAMRLRLDHIALDQSPVVSPLWTSTYGDEDLVGKVKYLAKSGHPNKLGRQVLRRYAAYVAVRWLRQLQH